jgi:HPt (histidine-containing phosphotransfer) domain-containing protein
VQLAHQVEDKRAQLTEAREQLTAALTALRDAIDTEAV